MFSRLIVSLIAAGVGLATLSPALSPAMAAEPVYPPGLRVGLVPQGDLVVSKHFAGFEDADRKVAITILDLPAAAYEEIQRSVFAEKQPAVTVQKRESFAFASGVGVLLTGQSEDKGVILHKWFLAASPGGGPVQDLTALVSVMVPDSARSVYSDAVIRAVLASVTFRPRPIEEQLALLPFKLANLAGFRVAQVSPSGGVILVDDESGDQPLHPYMIISLAGGGPENPDDRGRFARDIMATAPLRDLKIQLGEPMRISGSPGFEIRATAAGPRGDPVSVVQWLRFAGNGYMRIIGITRTNDWDAVFTRFRAVRDGIQFR